MKKKCKTDEDKNIAPLPLSKMSMCGECFSVCD